MGKKPANEWLWGIEDYTLPEDGATRELEGETYTYSATRAGYALDFIETFCRHIEGRWAGDPLILADWQRWLTGSAFGWLREDGTRQYRTVFLFVPRKNGKSTWGAAVALYLLMGDGEAGAQVFSAASDVQQAGIVHRVAELMGQSEPELEKRLKFVRRQISYLETASFYRVLSADAYTKHGLNAHGIIFDELHTQPSRDLWDVLDTGTVSREQPLLIAITTAGVLDRNSICWEQYSYAKQVTEGLIHDPTYLPMIFEAPQDAAWDDPETWRIANPNFEISVPAAYLAKQVRYAKQVPAAENTFRRLHLNQWTEQSVRWISLDAWRSCLGRVNADALRGQRCFVGLDLASTRDLTAMALVFPREEEDEPWPVLMRYWCPADTVRERSENDRVPYDQWVRDGTITATPGNVTDYAFIRREIHKLAERYRVGGMAIDRWNATQLAVQLEQDGLPVVLMAQGYAHMNAPSREFERRVVQGTILADESDSVLTWMVANVQRKEDSGGNIKPDKGGSGEKIDGVVALIMAIDQAIRDEGHRPSIYETEELFGL